MTDLVRASFCCNRFATRRPLLFETGGRDFANVNRITFKMNLQRCLFANFRPIGPVNGSASNLTALSYCSLAIERLPPRNAESLLLSFNRSLRRRSWNSLGRLLATYFMCYHSKCPFLSREFSAADWVHCGVPSI